MRGDVKFETLSELVVELDLGAEGVGGSPGLGESKAVKLVGIFCLDVTTDVVILGVTVAKDFEGDVGGRRSLDLKRCAVDVVFLSKEVIGRLAKVLYRGDLQ